MVKNKGRGKTSSRRTSTSNRGKKVRFNLSPRSQFPRAKAQMVATGSSIEDNAALVLAVFILFVIAGVTIAWPHIYKGTLQSESYRNFGSVGNKLTGNMAPQEYQNGSKTAGNRFVDANAEPNVRNTDNQVYTPTNLGAKASSALSASAARVLADMGTSTAGIATPPDGDPSSNRGTVMNDIKYATKGDGLIRTVDVNGIPINKSLVQGAMFSNHDFMFRHEAPQSQGLPHLQDPSAGPQKSHFGPMTYPLIFRGQALGMDVIGESNDTRATISFTGGRPPIF